MICASAAALSRYCLIPPEGCHGLVHYISKLFRRSDPPEKISLSNFLDLLTVVLVNVAVPIEVAGEKGGAAGGATSRECPGQARERGERGRGGGKRKVDPQWVRPRGRWQHDECPSVSHVLDAQRRD